MLGIQLFFSSIIYLSFDYSVFNNFSVVDMYFLCNKEFFSKVKTGDHNANTCKIKKTNILSKNLKIKNRNSYGRVNSLQQLILST